jgi:NADH:ubiquinone oxidoreductase subunit 3 (subunit A)
MLIQDIRSHKIFGLAIFDLSMSFIGVIAIFMVAWRIHFRNLDWWKFLIAAIIVTIPIGITFHVLFGTNTALNYKLGLSNKPSK